ncbi:MAG: DUF2530 domain-containing protein [Actinomycetota bacterium]|nr:DUF2530 domain-containing protein [Actinomycetota bacterium]
MATPQEPTSGSERESHARRRPVVEPLQVDASRVLNIGTAIWAVAFLALLPFHGRLADTGRGWWLWTCLAGVGLGLFGAEYCRRHDDRRRDRGVGGPASHRVPPAASGQDPPASTTPEGGTPPRDGTPAQAGMTPQDATAPLQDPWRATGGRRRRAP